MLVRRLLVGASYVQRNRRHQIEDEPTPQVADRHLPRLDDQLAVGILIARDEVDYHIEHEEGIKHAIEHVVAARVVRLQKGEAHRQLAGDEEHRRRREERPNRGDRRAGYENEPILAQASVYLRSAQPAPPPRGNV